MEQLKLRYRESELFTACPIPADSIGIIRIQIVTDLGKTKWLNIEPGEFRKIEQILLGA